MRDFAGAVMLADHRSQGTPGRRRRSRGWRWAIGLVSGAAILTASAVPAGATGGPMAAARPYLSRLTNQTEVGSTVPVNGDVNPYGVAVVGQSTGRLVAGDVLVSNFNAKSNFQGTGSTIVEIAPNGQQTCSPT